MRLATHLTRRVGTVLRRVGDDIVRLGGVKGTWIDVGAHHGEATLRWAEENPHLKIYALEPNLSAAAKLVGRSANFFVIPMAVAETDGSASLYVNACEAASSLLPVNQESLKSWIGGEALKVESVISVPTIRLDTLMNRTGIQRVDYLKVDTQGMDLAVVRSAGSRLADIAKITLEVDVKPTRLYSGAPSKGEVIAFLTGTGFSLTSVEKQTYGQEENLTFIRTDQEQRFSATHEWNE